MEVVEDQIQGAKELTYHRRYDQIVIRAKFCLLGLSCMEA